MAFITCLVHVNDSCTCVMFLKLMGRSGFLPVTLQSKYCNYVLLIFILVFCWLVYIEQLSTKMRPNYVSTYVTVNFV